MSYITFTKMQGNTLCQKNEELFIVTRGKDFCPDSYSYHADISRLRMNPKSILVVNLTQAGLAQDEWLIISHTK